MVSVDDQMQAGYNQPWRRKHASDSIIAHCRELACLFFIILEGRLYRIALKLACINVNRIRLYRLYLDMLNFVDHVLDILHIYF